MALANDQQRPNASVTITQSLQSSTCPISPGISTAVRLTLTLTSAQVIFTLRLLVLANEIGYDLSCLVELA